MPVLSCDNDEGMCKCPDPSPSGAIEGIISVCAAVEGLISRVQGSILDAAVPDLQTVAAGIYGPLCDQIDQ